MPFIDGSDGAQLYYKDWGSGPVVVFSHGWPLSADAWDTEMKLLADKGFRVIAHDRRGHGRSEHTWSGNDIDTYAADLDALVRRLGLTDIALVGHSTGGGEVVRYAARLGAGRVRKIVTIGAVPPVMVQSAANAEGTPVSVFNGIRAQVLDDRSQYWRELALAFYGFNRANTEFSQGLVDHFWLQGMRAGLVSVHDCVQAFSETDFTDDLKALDVPILIAHGDDDQIVPIHDAAAKAIELVRYGRLRVYPGAPHGIYGAYREQLMGDLLEFIGP
ncbi:alpha/beta hydrolase [Mycobacterium sp. 852013-50091_SCH5140682]|uniref:alpha/beta fold hydrolase n=1 Tax=Mycobacterium sp. 852013-50091_SCH5140682 TaxID=1834109 RepID=UPI0007EB4096|nr:alpha/beta hydrolase [Mycobacterium sp. 852013-50091_SCH5140682]OBC15397.1 alpha/beta hydrolase [Mycobacterium sp. 852013-50091_SCH5140682]